MEDKRDPRFQIHADLDQVQKDIEKAADDRKSEIKQEIKDQKKSLKEEAKDLKQEAKDNYKEYKDYKKESEDPLADEKIATAKKASKVVTKGIDLDYNDSKDMLEKEAEKRMESIDMMLSDSDEGSVTDQRERQLSDDTLMDATMMGGGVMGASMLGATMNDRPSDISASNNLNDNVAPKGQRYEQNRDGYLSSNRSGNDYDINKEQRSDIQGQQSNLRGQGSKIQGQDYGRTNQEYNRSSKEYGRTGNDFNRQESNRPGQGISNQGISNKSQEYIRPDYEIRDTLITDDASDEFLLIHEEHDLRNENQSWNQNKNEVPNVKSNEIRNANTNTNNEIRNPNDNEIRNEQSGIKEIKPTYGNKC